MKLLGSQGISIPPCSECGKGFNDLRKKRNHEVGCQVECKCLVCGKTFHNKDYLVRHQKIHSMEYKCEQCDRSFVNRTKIDSHQVAVHLQTKPYSCDGCGKTFARKDNLSRHKKGCLKCWKCSQYELLHTYLVRYCFVVYVKDFNFISPRSSKRGILIIIPVLLFFSDDRYYSIFLFRCWVMIIVEKNQSWRLQRCIFIHPYFRGNFE